MRVIKYLIERFGIGSNSTSYTAFQPQQKISAVQIQNSSHQTTDYIDAETIDYPTLKQLVIKNYPKNETEWILCYAFLSSKYGNDTFKKEDIVEGYRESNRYTATNKNNLTNNINGCIKKDWIKDINKEEFILKPEGISYAKEVLKGNSTSKEVKSTKRPQKKTKSTSEDIE